MMLEQSNALSLIFQNSLSVFTEKGARPWIVLKFPRPLDLIACLFEGLYNTSR
jgi:hypothetical protein